MLGERSRLFFGIPGVKGRPGLEYKDFGTQRVEFGLEFQVTDVGDSFIPPFRVFFAFSCSRSIAVKLEEAGDRFLIGVGLGRGFFFFAFPISFPGVLTLEDEGD